MFNFGDKVRITRGDLSGAIYHIVGWTDKKNRDHLMFQLGSIVDEKGHYQVVPLNTYFAADVLEAV